MRRPVKRALAGAVALAASLGTTSAAHAATGMEVALQDDPILLNLTGSYGFGNASERALGARNAALNRAHQLHVSTIRVNALWASIVGPSTAKKKSEPSNVSYNWDFVDSLLDAAAAKGIRVQVALVGEPAPAYATGNDKLGTYKVNATAFKHFAAAAGQHYAARAAAHQSIPLRFSIWNEPNYVSWLSPLGQQGTIYRNLYKAGWSGIRSAFAARHVKAPQILIAETAPYALRKRSVAPLAFLRQMLGANSKWKPKYKIYADGFAHHPYDFDHKPSYRYPGSDNVTIGTLSRLTSVLAKLKSNRGLRTPSLGRVPVYLTEYGYFATGKRAVSDSKRGSYLKQAYTIAQKNSQVKQMLQFGLVKPSGSTYSFFPTYLMNGGFKATKAYSAMVSWGNAAAKAGRIRP